MKDIIIRKDLLMGVATASTQIEGNDKNNTWYMWTKNHDKTKDGSTSLRANNHWNNYKAHIDLMKDMNLEIYRMSLEWSRIEPENGKFSEEAINHYIDEIKYLQKNNIKVLVTLHHFSNPIWFEKLGGFLREDSNIYFSRYTKYVVTHLKGLITDFCTINEPNVYATNCFFTGEWLNQKKSLSKTLKVLRNMANCHIESYKIIHDIIEDSKVGIALNINHFMPENPNNILDRIGSWFYDRAFNICAPYAMGYGKLMFPLGQSQKTGEYFDYFGMNYYTSNIVHIAERKNDSSWPTNDLGWGITPFGFYKELERFHKIFKNKEIYITENGTCDKDDLFRSKYLYDHLSIINNLSYVKRYYHWTFMDNFEWKEGESAKFGLVKYNYDDETYEVRNSGKFYSEIIKNRKITPEMLKKYNVEE